MSKRDIRKLKSFVRQLLIHLLKLHFSRQIEPRDHWIREVAEFRRSLDAILDNAPSLRTKLPALAAREWPAAVTTARRDLARRGDGTDALNSLHGLQLAGSGFESFLDPTFLPGPSENA